MGGITLLDFKTLYSYYNQDCMLLTEGEIFRSMEGNRELKNRSTPKTSDSFLTKVQKHFGGKIVFSTSDAGAIGHSLAKK